MTLLAGISGEKVEIDPVASKSGTRLFRQRAVTYDADSIASCDMIEEKDGGNCLTRKNTYFLTKYKEERERKRAYIKLT